MEPSRKGTIAICQLPLSSADVSDSLLFYFISLAFSFGFYVCTKVNYHSFCVVDDFGPFGENFFCFYVGVCGARQALNYIRN